MTQLYYDDSKLRIRVCGGMSCASNGGGWPLEDAFQRALDEWCVADRVEILRAHCLGECQNGPCLRIDGERFYHVTPADIPALVRDEVLPKI